MVDRFLEIVGAIGNWAYVIIFLAAALESSAFLGLIVPGESVVLVAGFLAAHGLLGVKTLIIGVALGAIIGDSIGYELGRRFGRPWLIRYGHHFGIRPAHLQRTDEFFQRHGGKTILLGRFVGFLRALAPFVAGSSAMRYRQFLSYNAAGGIFWSVAVVLLGYFFGTSWRAIERWMGRGSAVVFGMIVLALILTLWWRRRVAPRP